MPETESALIQVRYMAGYGAEYQHESISFSLALPRVREPEAQLPRSDAESVAAHA
ncbi:hypothetical protein [Streptomyces sp. NBC_00035]|uniref:hypothetical protein n=1 Tax=Streptomyces sp. NBC_00035 TaxID=2903614 RepID=UPI00324DE3E0